MSVFTLITSLFYLWFSYVLNVWICVDKFPRARARVSARKSVQKIPHFITCAGLQNVGFCSQLCHRKCDFLLPTFDVLYQRYNFSFDVFGKLRPSGYTHISQHAYTTLLSELSRTGRRCAYESLADRCVIEDGIFYMCVTLLYVNRFQNCCQCGIVFL